MYIDSHCHLNSEEYQNNLDEIISRAKEANVNGFLVIGWDLKSSKLALEISSNYQECFCALGIHPENVLEMQDGDLDNIKSLLKNNKVKAVGEIGLDYYWDKDEEHKKIQQAMFIKQIELANELNLPISVHSRDAIQDTYDILKKHPVKKRGIIHCYGGSLEMAKEFIKLGYKLGIGGIVTFKNSKVIKEVVTNISLNDIVLETDCPYLTPVPYRGKINEPSYIPLIASEIATLKNISIDEVMTITTSNTKEVFDL